MVDGRRTLSHPLRRRQATGEASFLISTWLQDGNLALGGLLCAKPIGSLQGNPNADNSGTR